MIHETSDRESRAVVYESPTRNFNEDRGGERGNRQRAFLMIHSFHSAESIAPDRGLHRFPIRMNNERDRISKMDEEEGP